MNALCWKNVAKYKIVNWKLLFISKLRCLMLRRILDGKPDGVMLINGGTIQKAFIWYFWTGLKNFQNLTAGAGGAKILGLFTIFFAQKLGFFPKGHSFLRTVTPPYCTPARYVGIFRNFRIWNFFGRRRHCFRMNVLQVKSSGGGIRLQFQFRITAKKSCSSCWLMIRPKMFNHNYYFDL